MAKSPLADQDIISFAVPLDTHSIFKSFSVCEAFLSLHGVSDTAGFFLAYFRLLQRVVLTRGHKPSKSAVTVNVERLDEDTIRITVESDGEANHHQQIDTCVAHISNRVESQSGGVKPDNHKVGS